MNKKLLIILLLTAGLRLYLLRQPYFIGNDAYLHYKVMEQAMSGEGLNNYLLGFGSPVILEPKGFYYVTIMLGYLISLKAAFLLIPVIAGVVSVYYSYLLMKKLFNERTGLLTALITSLMIAHIYRTSANTYRGDGLFLALFMATLYYFTERKGLTTGLLMSLTATVWNGYPVGVLTIISGLIINSTNKYIHNKLKIEDLRFTFNVSVTYYFTELIFLMTGVIKPIFFTVNEAVHALIVFSPLLMTVIYYFTKKAKKGMIIGFIIIALIIILSLNINTIIEMINTGLLENHFFYKVGVSELLPPSHQFLFLMLSITLYAMWGGLILLLLNIKKTRDTNKLTFLVWSLVTSYLMINYSRYNFIASTSVAGLTAILLNYVYKLRNKRIALLIIGLFFITYAVNLQNINKIGPRMNYYWEEALTWMKSNLEPGMTLTWWDHGSWVQYYAGFPTITDSVTGQAVDRIQRTARFLMTSDYDDFADWNVSYLIVGGDDMMYNGAIISIANVSDLKIEYLPRPVSYDGGLMIKTSDGYFEVNADKLVFRTIYGNELPLNTTYINNNNETMTLQSNIPNAHNCLAITPAYNWFLNDKACNTNYVKLMYGNGLKGYELVYRNPFIAVYKIQRV